MPFVPTTGSRMKPAIVCGPSNMMTSSRSRERPLDRLGLGPAPAMRVGRADDAGTRPVSAAQRRGSPVAAMTWPVAPWYER